MFTIGPWWFYDFFITLIFLFVVYKSIRNGFFVALYFLIYFVFIYLILTFIPQLVANFLLPKITLLIYQSPIYSSIDSFSQTMGNSIGQLINKMIGSSINFSASDLVNSMVLSVIGIFLYMLIFFFMLSVMLTSMVVIYFIIKNKLKSARINLYVSSFLGSIFGILVGIIIGSIFSIILGLPLFDYSSQKIGITKLEGKNVEELLEDKFAHGNQYKKYGIVSQLENVIPLSNTTISYQFSCFEKYLMLPLVRIVSDKTWEKNSDSFESVLKPFESTFLEGYYSKNIFHYPLKTSLGLLPKGTQSSISFMVDFILTASIIDKAIVANRSSIPSPLGQAGILFYQMDSYKKVNNIKYFNRSEFIKFYNSLEKPKSQKDTGEDYNQFLVTSFYYQNEQKVNDGTEGFKKTLYLLENPGVLYDYLSNVYYIIEHYRTIDTLPFMPSIFSSLYLLQGLEIVPGVNVSGLLSWTWLPFEGKMGDINDFELGEYMDYANK